MPTEGKFKAKDLSYDSTLPPFLQRLHAQKAGLGDQDRHERPVARPKRLKNNEDGDDDGPTVVDESGENVSSQDLEKMQKPGDVPAALEEGGNVKGELKGDGEPMASGALQDGPGKGEQKVTDGTATKKRKVAKVVGEEGEEKVEGEQEAKNPVKKAKKKTKPIKLAFDNDEDDET